MLRLKQVTDPKWASVVLQDLGAFLIDHAYCERKASGTALNTVINNIDAAINDVNNQRAVFGATQNRFNAVITNLQHSVENQSAAASRITDADFASETANMSRANVLQQAGTAMIAQANQQPQQVLSLLR